MTALGEVYQDFGEECADLSEEINLCDGEEEGRREFELC
jgi:hypothetical protein